MCVDNSALLMYHVPDDPAFSVKCKKTKPSNENTKINAATRVVGNSMWWDVGLCSND